MKSLLDSLIPVAGTLIAKSRDGIRMVGPQRQWAQAAFARFEREAATNGPIRVTLKITVPVGKVSAGILAADERSFLVEKLLRTGAQTTVVLHVQNDADAAGVLLRTWEDCGRPPEILIHDVTIATHPFEPEYVAEPGVDPQVETLWPLPFGQYSVNRLRGWDEQTLRANLSGDPLHDNLVLNKWEFAHGIAKLKSLPWRVSIPFVLCNARCDFCAAWLMKGNANLDGLINLLIPVIRSSYQIDLVGWGEPLIHPQFDQILHVIKNEADRRARIALTTNGTRLDEWMDRLIEANIMHYIISVHATNSRTHQDLMGLDPNDFDRVIASARRLGDRKVENDRLNMEMVMVVTQQNLAEIPRFIEMSEEIGADSVHLRTLMPQEEPRAGLDYHRLPPYLHPDFEGLRAAAVAAVGRSRLQIKADPATWARPVFSPDWEPRLPTLPLTPREQRTYMRLAEIKWSELGAGEASAVPSEACTTENVYGRQAPLYCPSPYTAFYAHGFDHRVLPCVYIQKVPGYEFIHFKPTMTFDEVWNSPAMVAVRKSLHTGPLLPTCLKCPFYC
jgi:MoaA/NifB/PqqE/SkfB family radical SAM enzyme